MIYQPADVLDCSGVDRVVRSLLLVGWMGWFPRLALMQKFASE